MSTHNMYCGKIRKILGDYPLIWRYGKDVNLFVVTECEIQDGILKAADVDSHVLVYRRQLSQLDETSLAEENASRYIDVKQNGEVGLLLTLKY